MSANVPVRREQLRHKLTAFRSWLVENGAEIGLPTNTYEVLRYRAYWRNTRTSSVHIIYAKESGLLTWTAGSLGHFRAFLDGLPMDGNKTAPVKLQTDQDEAAETVSATKRRRTKLLARDGSDCWFCGIALGDDITIEHLIPRSRGGGNDTANLVLAHRQCNANAADLSISEKVEMRTRLRSLATTADRANKEQ